MSINAISGVNFKSDYPNVRNHKVSSESQYPMQERSYLNSDCGEDEVCFTKENAEIIDIPRIGTARIIFNRLTDKQIETINKTGRLPDNAKFVANGQGGYVITNNFMDLRIGTQTLPEGFEVKKDVFGFTCVLPKGSHGLMVK